MDCFTVLKRRRTYASLAVLFIVMALANAGLSLYVYTSLMLISAGISIIFAIFYTVLARDFNRLAVEKCLREQTQ